MELTTNKSRRGVELRPLTTFSVVQADQYCSMLATHHQLLFHVTYQQLHVWNWQKQGQRVEGESYNLYCIVSVLVVDLAHHFMYQLAVIVN